MKDFIFEDFEKYVGTDFLKVPGKSPTLYYFGLNGKVVEQFDITEKSRTELNAMMTTRGFRIKGARFSEL